MWRRCFDRDFEFKGENYISYAELEGFYIIDNINLCDKYPYYKFTVESVSVLRKFLEHHPEYEDKINELFKEKRIFVTMSGDNIIDTNMVQGESIIRNYLYGLEFLNDKYNYIPYGLDRNDAFGNCAQLPQIARGFDTKWVYHLTYSTSDKDYWKGIDGSTLYCYDPPRICTTGGYYKYAPCPSCKGYKLTHCDVCNDRRINVPAMEKIRIGINPNTKLIDSSSIPGYILVSGEEILPTNNIIKWLEDNKDKYDIEFTSFESYKQYIEDKLNHTDSASENELHSSCEINPNNTGTYVTRIQTKQKVRKNENLISTAETLGTLLGVNGQQFNTEFIKKMWEKLHFCMFHDAITATHIDAAYYELMETHSLLEHALLYSISQSKRNMTIKNTNTVTVINTLGINTVCSSLVTVDTHEDVTLVDENGHTASIISKKKTDDGVMIHFIAGELKSFESKKFTVVPCKNYNIDYTNFAKTSAVAADSVLTNIIDNNTENCIDKEVNIENEYYIITATENGITSIYDKKLNQNVAQKSTYYVGELILEHDEGSPWTTLSIDVRRQSLSPNTKLTRFESTNDYQELVFKTAPGDLCAYSVNSFNAECRVRLQRGCNKVLFSTNVFWDTQNYRLRIAFPSLIKGKHIYEIPYGYIERSPYTPTTLWNSGDSNWAGASGDWPAINWAGIEGENTSIAIINKGTPSYQINSDENDVDNIYLTVLRSPSVGTYLHDPGKAYSMTDYDGMRDAGNHHFEYALIAYEKGFYENNAVADSIAYNSNTVSINGDIINYYMPEIISNDVRISAVKHSQKDNWLIYRLVEFHGINSSITIKIPNQLNIDKVYEMNLNEKIISEIPIKDNVAIIDIEKFKIKTIAFKIN